MNANDSHPLLHSPVAFALLSRLNLRDFLQCRVVCKKWHTIADGAQDKWIALMMLAHFPITTDSDGHVVLALKKTIPLRVQLAQHIGRRKKERLARSLHHWQLHMKQLELQKEQGRRAIDTIAREIDACARVLESLGKVPRKRFSLVNSKLIVKRKNKKKE